MSFDLLPKHLLQFIVLFSLICHVIPWKPELNFILWGLVFQLGYNRLLLLALDIKLLDLLLQLVHISPLLVI
jgi:hypothetical protein